MTAKEFETTLRELLNKKPFHPFAVEYANGERFEVDGPHVAFAGGGASFQSADGEIYFFSYRDVRQFLPAPQEAHS
jgi:hypothetical protein